MGWFSTILKVVNTASGWYLNNFGADYELSADNEMDAKNVKVLSHIGPLKFHYYSNVNEIWVYNTDPEKGYYIYFSSVNKENNSLSSKHLLIEKKGEEHEGLNVTEEMKKFGDGEISYVPDVAEDDPNKSVALFTAEYILTDEIIFDDDDTEDKKDYVLRRNKNKTEFIFTAKQKFERFSISFTDKNNVNFNLKDLSISPVKDKYEARVEFPKGCDPNFPFKNVRIEITISGEYRDELHRKLLAKNK